MTTRVYPAEDVRNSGMQETPENDLPHARHEEILVRDDFGLFDDDEDARSYARRQRSNSGGSSRKVGKDDNLMGVRFQDIQGFHMDENKSKYDRQFCHITKAHKGGYLPGIALNPDGHLAACFSGKLAYYTKHFLATGIDAGEDHWQRSPQNHKETTMKAVCFGHRMVAFGGYDGSVVVYNLKGEELWRREDVCTGEVRTLVISCPGGQRANCDGDVICAAGFDGTISIFDEEGRALCKPIRKAHRDSAIMHAVFNVDGNKLATSAADGSIIVRLKTGSAGQWEDEWHDYDTHKRRKVQAMIYIDPKHLVSGGDDGSIVFHHSYGEERAGNTIRNVFGGDVALRALALTPNAQRLAAAGKNGAIAIFNLDVNAHANLWTRIDGIHIGGKRMCLAFTDLGHLVSASSAGTYCVHDVSGTDVKEVMRKAVVSREEEGVPINSIISMCCGKYKGIATGGQDGCIKFFDYHGSEVRKPLEAVHGGAGVAEIAWLPLLSGNGYRSLNPSSSKGPFSASSHQPSLTEETSGNIVGLRGFLASAGENGSVVCHFLDGTNQSIVWQFNPQDFSGFKVKRVYGVAIVNKEGPRLAFCGDKGLLAVVSHLHEEERGPAWWDNGNNMLDDLEESVAKGKVKPDLRSMRAVCFSADQRVACSCEDGFIRVYGEEKRNEDRFELLWKGGICEEGMAAFSLAFSPMNGYIAVGRHDGLVLLFGPHGERIRTIVGRRGKLRAVRFANDGCMAVTGNNGSIVLYGASGEEIWSADNIHRGFRVYGLTFIDGRSGHIATAGDDGSVNIFSPFRNQVGFKSDAHESKRVLGLALSHRGTLASGGSSGDLIIENTRSQTRRKVESPHKMMCDSPTSASSSKSRHEIRALAFQHGPGDMELLASSGEDGSICIFEVPARDDIKLLKKFERETDLVDRYVLSLAFPYKGTEHDDRLAAGGKDGLIEILRINPRQDQYERIKTIDMVGYIMEQHKFDAKRPHFPCSSILRLSFSHDGEHLCASNGRGLVVVIIFDENSDIGGCICLYTPHGSSGLISVAFSPEDYLLATGGFDGSVALWGPSFRDGWSAEIGKPEAGKTGLRIRSADVEGMLEIARVQSAHYDDKIRDLKFTATGLLVTAGANIVHLWKRPLERVAMFPFNETVFQLSVGLHGWRPWDVSIAVALKGGKVKSFSPNEFPLSLCLKAVAALIRDNKKTEALLKYHPRILAQPLPKERCSLIHFCMMQGDNSSRRAFDSVHRLCALCINSKIWGGLDSNPSCVTGESTNLLHIALRQAEYTRDTSIVELILSYASRLPEWCTNCKDWTAAVLECITSFPMHSLGLVDFLDSRLVPVKPQIQKGRRHAEDHPTTADFSKSWGKLHVTHEKSSTLSKKELKKTLAPEGCDKLEIRVLLLPGIADCPHSKQPLLNITPVLSQEIITSKAMQALIMHKWNNYGFRANCQGFAVHFLEIAAYSLLAVVSARAAAAEDEGLNLMKHQEWQDMDLFLRVVLAPALALWVLGIMIGYPSLWRTKPDVIANSLFMLAQVVGSICVIFKVMRSLWVVPLLGLTVTRWELTTLVRAWQWHVGVPLPVGAREEHGWQGLKKLGKTSHWRTVYGGRFAWLSQYFSSYWNWLDMTLFILKIFVPFSVFWLGMSVHLAVVFYSILLGMLVGKTLYYLRALPHIGHMTSMIWEVWSSTVYFIAVMVIILLGLAIAWTVLALANPDAHFLQEEDTEICEPDGEGGFACGSQAQKFGSVFAVFAASFFTMYRLVFVGDFAGDAFALSDWSAIPGDEPKIGTVFPAWVVFVIGTIFFLIIALNLLIAIVNDRYRELMDQSYVRFWRERAMISIEAEMFMLHRKRSERGVDKWESKKWPDNPPKYLMMSFPGTQSVTKTLDDKSVCKVARDVHGTSNCQEENEEDGLNHRMDKMENYLSTMQQSIKSLSRQMKGVSADIRGAGANPWRPHSDMAKDQMAECLSRMQLCIECFGEQMKYVSTSTGDSSSATGFTPITEPTGVTPMTATNARDAADMQTLQDFMAWHGDNASTQSRMALQQQQLQQVPQLPLRELSARQAPLQQEAFRQRPEQPQLQRLQPQHLMDQLQQLVEEMQCMQQMHDATPAARRAVRAFSGLLEPTPRAFSKSHSFKLGAKDGLDDHGITARPGTGDPACRRTFDVEDRPPTRHGSDSFSLSGSRRRVSLPALGFQVAREASELPTESSRPRSSHGLPPSAPSEPQILAFEDGQPRPLGSPSSGTPRENLVRAVTGASPAALEEVGMRPQDASRVTPPNPAAAPLAVLPTEPKATPPQFAPPKAGPAPAPPPPPAASSLATLPTEAPAPAMSRPEPSPGTAAAAAAGSASAATATGAEAAAPVHEFRAEARVEKRKPSKSGSGLSMKSAMSMMAAESASGNAANQAAPAPPAAPTSAPADPPAAPTSAPADIEEGAILSDESVMDIS